MARLTAISGLGRKAAAIFLLETRGRRVLLDLGAGLERDERPDLSAVGMVDAVILSHAHVDHAGALDRLPEIGGPSVHASAETLRQLGLPVRDALPENGVAQVAGLTVGTGRAGHAPGGIWIHFPDVGAGGFLYTGDFSLEARLLRFDPFPQAATVLADASYGDRDEPLRAQVTALARLARGGAVLPCPTHGRGPDMVAALAGQGLWVHACARIAAECARMGLGVPVVDADTARPDQAIVAAGPNAEEGLPAALLHRPGFRFVFSSHVPLTSPAHAALAEGRARWMGWNVHPRLSDLIALRAATGADRIIPAFIDLAQAPRLVAALGPALWNGETCDL